MYFGEQQAAARPGLLRKLTNYVNNAINDANNEFLP